MAAQPIPRKPCYKCGKFTEVSVAEMHNGQRHTTCSTCKVKINIEWDQAIAHTQKQGSAA
jgi:hypothetical protein